MSVIRRRSPATPVERSSDRPGRGAPVRGVGSAGVPWSWPPVPRHWPWPDRFALRPFVDAAGAAGAAGEVAVAFVLDFGARHHRQVTGCVDVPASDNRYDALAAFVEREGSGTAHLRREWAAVLDQRRSRRPDAARWSAADTSTGRTSPAVQGGWTYASTGAFGTGQPPDDVEGWRFQNPGSGRPNDPPPRIHRPIRRHMRIGRGHPAGHPTVRWWQHRRVERGIPTAAVPPRLRPLRFRRQLEAHIHDHVVHVDHHDHIDLSARHHHLATRYPGAGRSGKGTGSRQALVGRLRLGAGPRSADHRRPARGRPGHRRLHPVAQASAYPVRPPSR